VFSLGSVMSAVLFPLKV